MCYLYQTQGGEKMYKDIVVPMISQLIDNLKSKRIGDIKVYLLGITRKFPFAAVYDTDRKFQPSRTSYLI